jgi:ribosome-associated translation inhibitor RaiA
MRIEIVGDDSIGHQARIYAEYRLFAALSQAVDTRDVRAASLVLSRATNERQTGDDVVCAVTLEMHNGEIERLRGAGAHPYAAINAVVDRLRPKLRDEPQARSRATSELNRSAS